MQLTIDHLQWEWDRLERLRTHRLFAKPMQQIDDGRQEVDDWAERLLDATKRRLLQSQKELARRAAVLAALSPLQVLGRGYSLTLNSVTKTPIVASSQIAIGETMETILHEGRILSRVESV